MTSFCKYLKCMNYIYVLNIFETLDIFISFKASIYYFIK